MDVVLVHALHIQSFKRQIVKAQRLYPEYFSSWPASKMHLRLHRQLCDTGSFFTYSHDANGLRTLRTLKGILHDEEDHLEINIRGEKMFL